MKAILTAAMISVFGMTAALAAEDQNMTGKAESQHPGTSAARHNSYAEREA